MTLELPMGFRSIWTVHVGQIIRCVRRAYKESEEGGLSLGLPPTQFRFRSVSGRPTSRIINKTIRWSLLRQVSIQYKFKFIAEIACKYALHYTLHCRTNLRFVAIGTPIPVYL